MSERFEPKRVLQDPDVPNIGAFGGLSSASYQSTGDILYADKLVNATITSRNEVKRRRGSRIITSIFNRTLTGALNTTSYRFTFDGVNYIACRVQRELHLYSYTSGMQLQKSVIKTGVFFSASDNETAKFSVVIEDDHCYILAATESTPLVIGVILKRNLNSVVINSATQFTGSINYYPESNLINNNNSYIYDQNGNLIQTSTITQTLATIVSTTATAHGLTNSRLRIHSFFWCRGAAANYYPGNYLYNSAVRRNTVPLDVNVQLPNEISSNPLINENPIQNLSLRTTDIWQTTSAPGFTRVTNNQPTTSTQWDFSDGSYTANVNNFTNRTPNFVAFGALAAGGNVERVYIFRSREVLLAKGTTVAAVDLGFFTDKISTAVNYYDVTRTTTTTDCVYFSVQSASRPSLSSVCELVYFKDSNTNTLVDLTKATNLSVLIGDGWAVPLYGYAAFNNTSNQSYCPLVSSVGNRVVLSGLDNRVVFSDANWNYRGISWNNFQVSTINYIPSSAYSIVMGQQSSEVLGLASVNGVLIVATDTGIFRISGDNSQTPPNATTANVSRLSNEILNTSDCLLVYENKVYYTSSNGLYQLQYNQDIDELTPTPVSVQVTDIFRRIPVCLNYSPTYRAFIVGFNSGQELLVYSFESETFSTFKFSFTSPRVFLSQTLDGYQVLFAETDEEYTVCLCQWDNTLTTDISNASTLPSTTTIVGTSVNISTAPTDVSVLSTPSELIETLDTGNLGTFVVAYGDNTARLTSGSPQTLTEHTGGRQPTPILSFYVSKAFMSDKLIRSHRVRAINLLVAGSGELTTSVYFPNKEQSQQTYEITSVNLSPGVVRERANVETRTASGDLVNVRLRLTGGVGEGWVIACQLTQDLLLLGYQFDTGVKKRGRLQ